MAKRKAKSRGAPPFVMLPHELLEHEAVTTLTAGTFKVLVVLIRHYKGKNNGAVSITREQAAAFGITKDTLWRGLKTLAKRGLIVQTFPASRVPPRPAQHALTWLATQDTEHSSHAPPSFAYRKWTAQKNSKPARPELRIVAGTGIDS